MSGVHATGVGRTWRVAPVRGVVGVGRIPARRRQFGVVWVRWILFEYTLANAASAAGQTVWSHAVLQPVGAGALTPFSASVLTELCRRAWYAYYDRLGFQPAPRAPVVRSHRGRVYLNRSLFAQLDAEQAGLVPGSLRVNGQPLPLAAWEKPGLLAGFKHGRAQKRIDALLAELSSQLPAFTTKARAWYIRTQELRWTQAEVLQVMEEIERIGTEAMTAFLAARHNLETLYRLLLAGLDGQVTAAQGVLLIGGALGELPGLVEADIARALLHLGESMQDTAQLAWLKAGDYARWQTTLPGQPAADQANAFMDVYGHRSIHEGELARPRWVEEPDAVFAGLAACVQAAPQAAGNPPAGDGLPKLLDALTPQARKQGQASIEKARQLHLLQSRALHALAYIWAGTRRWALAAAREALADGRLQARDDIFYYELEEIKEMMTGEWNVSSRAEILGGAAERKVALARLQAETAPDLLIGDQEAQRTRAGLPAVAGHATGPFHRWGLGQQDGCPAAIVGAEVLNSGWALALPPANGFVAAGGTPMDPFVAAAAAWHHPVIVDFGPAYAELVEGAVTTVDAGAATVSQ